MNEVIKTIKARRSIRRFKPCPIKHDDAKQILECGLAGPRAMGQNSLLFVVLQEGENKKELLALSKEKFSYLRSFFYDAPLIVIVFASSDAKCPIEDGATALENMFVAAKSLGIGSCWINYLRELFKLEEGRLLQEKMNIPSSYFVVGTGVFGYPAEEKEEKTINTAAVRYL